jgi:ATP-dependent phosphofructokinase / diphosphate-dependent phosphofructokinase
MTRRIGILTAGSDCPGLNAAIRAIGKASQAESEVKIIGFLDGFLGLMNDLTVQPALSGILTLGGTTLGTSREIPQDVQINGQSVDLTESAIETYKKHKLDLLVCIGGSETQKAALHLSRQGLHVITLPKGVANELAMTDYTIGFDTAMSTATEAIDRLHSTAHSHHRIILVEILGRHCGWLTLGAGVAGGADVIIIPEIPYELDKITGAILERNRSGKRFSIVAVAEGGISRETVEFYQRSRQINHTLRSGADATAVDNQLEKIENRLTGNTIFLANQLGKLTGLDTRITILGHLLRGGAPTAFDRLLATNLGTACIRLFQKGDTGVMVSIQNESIIPVPLEQVAGQRKQVSDDHPWLHSARRVGTNLGI